MRIENKLFWDTLKKCDDETFMYEAYCEKCGKITKWGSTCMVACSAWWCRECTNCIANDYGLGDEFNI